ncbi:MAG: hypothetical protein IAE95_05135 [Chitinophagaceae bacterium]|nr:hypothetical protein [Chitinophagaceae bacterium]
MRYCKTTTENHSVAFDFPNCIEAFDTIITNEDENHIIATPLFREDETAINLDAVERIAANNEARDLNKSIDIAFGLSEIGTNVRFIVMTEFKLNYQNGVRNFKLKDINEKITHSSNLLGNTVSIYPVCFFVFSENHVNEAINKLSRFYPDPEVRKTRLAITIHSLRSFFFDH